MQAPIFLWKELDTAAKLRLLSRSEFDILEAIEKVKPILHMVKARGDAALRECTARFDQVNIEGIPLKAEPKEFLEAAKALSRSVKDALNYSIENVQTFHRKQLPPALTLTEVRPGVLAGERSTPIPSVGLYVPKGKGSFPSMLYMLAVPAVIAGVKDIKIVTPPSSDGAIDSACLYAAEILGIHEVYRVGGAQGIAALAYGTESVTKVCKILGPGSTYVTAAKKLVSDTVDVGLPAGPSEAVILADHSADPCLVALDLLIEAEHGPDSAAFVITPSLALAHEVARIIRQRVEEIPEPRKSFVTTVFQQYGGILLVDSMEEAVEVSDAFAPEHLQLQVEHPFELLGRIQHAGEILLGSATPFSAANYATGANAVLPTGGWAKTYSPVSVRDFIKYSSVVHVTPSGFSSLQPHVKALADYEGFPSHAIGVANRTPRGTYAE